MLCYPVFEVEVCFCLSSLQSICQRSETWQLDVIEPVIISDVCQAVLALIVFCNIQSARFVSAKLHLADGQCSMRKSPLRSTLTLKGSSPQRSASVVIARAKDSGFLSKTILPIKS